jgi:hypothetical protein
MACIPSDKGREDLDKHSTVESVSDSGLQSQNELRNRKAPVLVSSLSKDEPIVTRKELWSYYCAYFVFQTLEQSSTIGEKCITMVTM